MPTSHIIVLPLDRTPEWPDTCILCSNDEPGSAFRFRADRIGWDQIVTLNWALGRRPQVEAPACAQCARALRRSRWARSLCSWFIILPVTFAILYVLDRHLGWFDGSLRPYRKWITVGVLLVALLPYMAWEVHHPPRIDATARGKKIDYDFADPGYAARFAELNGEHVIG